MENQLKKEIQFLKVIIYGINFFEDGITDDYFSTRWFVNSFNAISNEKVARVKQLDLHSAFCCLLLQEWIGRCFSLFIQY